MVSTATTSRFMRRSGAPTAPAAAAGAVTGAAVVGAAADVAAGAAADVAAAAGRAHVDSCVTVLYQ